MTQLSRALKRPQAKEKAIENQILSWLKIKKIFAFKVESVGVFDQKLGRYRMKHSVHKRNGISDIIGIFENRFLAIEVKALKGRLSDHQREFLEEVNENGGIGFVARSIEDVEQELNKRAGA